MGLLVNEGAGAVQGVTEAMSFPNGTGTAA
jgi:hypothetical protein